MRCNKKAGNLCDKIVHNRATQPPALIILEASLTFARSESKPQAMILFLAKMVATLFGVGKWPVAPGTMGAIFAAVVWWFLQPVSWAGQGIMILVALAIGWLATAYYEHKEGLHDPKEVVVDELIGLWIALLGAPRSIHIFLIGFLFFRLFDIWKPFPVGWIDRKVPGASGTILDDVAAGIMAYVLLYIVFASGVLFWIN